MVLCLVFWGGYDFINGFNKNLKTEPADSTVVIPSPGCFFPDSKKEINSLLLKLRQESNWKVISALDVSGNPDLEGLLAYRVFDEKVKILRKEKNGYVELDNSDKNPNLIGYKVALIDASKSKKQVFSSSELGYKLTTVMCDRKNINLSIHSTFKFGMQSSLLFQNEIVGLVVFEMGNDTRRVFTVEALNTVRDEVTRAMK